MQTLSIAILIAYLFSFYICFIKTFSSILFSLKTDLSIFLDIDCISFYQLLPQKLPSILSTFLVLIGNKLNNTTFLEINTYKFIKSPNIRLQLLEKFVFPFLELASELNANSNKYAFFILNRFNFNNFRLYTYKLQSKF